MGYFIRRGDLLAYDRTNLLNEQVKRIFGWLAHRIPIKKVPMDILLTTDFRLSLSRARAH